MSTLSYRSISLDSILTLTNDNQFESFKKKYLKEKLDNLNKNFHGRSRRKMDGFVFLNDHKLSDQNKKKLFNDLDVNCNNSNCEENDCDNSSQSQSLSQDTIFSNSLNDDETDNSFCNERPTSDSFLDRKDVSPPNNVFVERKDLNKSMTSSNEKSYPPKKKRANAWYNAFNPTYKQKNTEFHKLFKSIPSKETLLVDYSCALQKDILLHGRLYVTNATICFYCNLFGWETNICIPIKNVDNITKEKTAKFIPNAIQIVLKTKEKYFFTSFTSREKTFVMLFRIWQNFLLKKPMSHDELLTLLKLHYGDQIDKDSISTIWNFESEDSPSDTDGSFLSEKKNGTENKLNEKKRIVLSKKKQVIVQNLDDLNVNQNSLFSSSIKHQLKNEDNQRVLKKGDLPNNLFLQVPQKKEKFDGDSSDYQKRIPKRVKSEIILKKRSSDINPLNESCSFNNRILSSTKPYVAKPIDQLCKMVCENEESKLDSGSYQLMEKKMAGNSFEELENNVHCDCDDHLPISYLDEIFEIELEHLFKYVALNSTFFREYCKSTGRSNVTYTKWHRHRQKEPSSSEVSSEPFDQTCNDSGVTKTFNVSDSGEEINEKKIQSIIDDDDLYRTDSSDLESITPHHKEKNEEMKKHLCQMTSIPSYVSHVRILSYVISIRAIMVKRVTTTDVQYIHKKSKKNHRYIIDSKATSAGVLYADCFCVSSRFCLTRIDNHRSRLRITGDIEPIKSMTNMVLNFAKNDIRTRVHANFEKLKNNLLEEAKKNRKMLMTVIPECNKSTKSVFSSDDEQEDDDDGNDSDYENLKSTKNDSMKKDLNHRRKPIEGTLFTTSKTQSGGTSGNMIRSRLNSRRKYRQIDDEYDRKHRNDNFENNTISFDGISNINITLGNYSIKMSSIILIITFLLLAMILINIVLYYKLYKVEQMAEEMAKRRL
ncbi:hypothetical protein SNEBB_008013 [Seison nebaliae]|nr:hypothetical protein SNEBB_008013 [Seison nebaliae]